MSTRKPHRIRQFFSGEYRLLPVFVAVALFSVLITIAMVRVGYEIGMAIMGLLIGGPILILSIIYPKVGFLFITLIAFLIFTLIRLRPTIPFGTLLDLTIYGTFLGVVIAKRSKPEFKSVGFLKSPVTIVYLIWVGYQIMQVANPNSYGLQGWLISLRSLLVGFCLYFIAYHVLKDINYIKLFTKFWLTLALLVAIYGIKQEIFGYTTWEMNWLLLNPKVYGLSTVGGIPRRFSILADVSNFGMFMAFSSIMTLVLMMGNFAGWKKLILFISLVIMLISMVFSYTRTAYAMIPVGLIVYVLLTLNNKKTIVFFVIGIFCFAVLIFGPFYSGPINRIRSTFRPSEDASYNVRDNNRASIQPYIQSHPIGGGPNTTGTSGEMYHSGHPLAGFPPDNGYLRVALEYGYIGLFINLGIYVTLLITSTINFFKSNRKDVKILYASYMSSFYAISVANFAQVAVGQMPISLLIVACYVISHRLIENENK